MVKFSLAFTFLLLSAFSNDVISLDNGLGLTPAMGFNTWNKLHCDDINEDKLKDIAKSIKEKGLLDLGYNYFNIDDCWSVKNGRDSNGNIVADPNKFPSGMKAFGDYVHDLGFKFGIYSSAGYTTCAGYPASYTKEDIDAQLFANFGVDYLKYDYCGNDSLEPEMLYPRMRDALNKTRRPILYSLCEWGVNFPAAWAGDVGNSWRTTGDIFPTIDSIFSIIRQNAKLWRHAGPGAFNDPDMLEVGNGNMTYSEQELHFVMWSIMKSPLLIGCDVSTIDDKTLGIVSNEELIAINQDPLGVQARRIDSNRKRRDDEEDVGVKKCGNNIRNITQKWEFLSNGFLVNEDNGLCLYKTSDKSENAVNLRPCPTSNDKEDISFLWEYHSDNGLIANKQDISLSLGVQKSPKMDELILGANTGNRFEWTIHNKSGYIINKRQGLCLSVEVDALEGDQEVWEGPLVDGGVVLAILNMNNTTSSSITVDFSSVSELLQSDTMYSFRDVLLHQDVGNFQNSFTAVVPEHSIKVYKVVEMQMKKVQK